MRIEKTENVRRIVNGHDDFASSRLRVHGEEP